MPVGGWPAPDGAYGGRIQQRPQAQGKRAPEREGKQGTENGQQVAVPESRQGARPDGGDAVRAGDPRAWRHAATLRRAVELAISRILWPGLHRARATYFAPLENPIAGQRPGLPRAGRARPP